MTLILITSLAANLILLILFLASLRKIKNKNIEIESIVGDRPNDRKQSKKKITNTQSVVGNRPDDR